MFIGVFGLVGFGFAIRKLFLWFALSYYWIYGLSRKSCIFTQFYPNFPEQINFVLVKTISLRVAKQIIEESGFIISIHLVPDNKYIKNSLALCFYFLIKVSLYLFIGIFKGDLLEWWILAKLMPFWKSATLTVNVLTVQLFLWKMIIVLAIKLNSTVLITKNEDIFLFLPFKYLMMK